MTFYGKVVAVLNYVRRLEDVFFNWAPCLEDVLGSGGMALRLLELGVFFVSSQSFERR